MRAMNDDNSFIDNMMYLISAKYIQLVYFLFLRFGIRMKGIGRVSRELIRKSRTVLCKGVLFHYDHNISGSYGLIVGGYWNEPETHMFLNSILTAMSKPVNFIDVGANIGEMVLDVARMPNAGDIIAFEPHPDCAEACVKSAALNNFINLEVRGKALGREKGSFPFNYHPSGGPSSSFGETAGRSLVEMATLDDETKKINGDSILMLDIEGGELEAIKGGRSFIRSFRPLIIFEYNEVTKEHFSIDEMAAELGSGYKIYRLRSGDGLLDRHTSDAWNCVAVHEDGLFWGICKALLHEA